MTPSIETAKNLADLLNTTASYLLGENDEANIFKDPEILERIKAIKAFDKEEKEKFTLRLMPLYMKWETENNTQTNNNR